MTETNSASADVVNEITSGHGRNLNQAARLFPPYREERRVNASTIFRWIVEGVRRPDGTRLRLEGARVGGRWLTSSQAIERFIRAQTPHLEAAERPRERTQKQRERAAERAGKQLGHVGI